MAKDKQQKKKKGRSTQELIGIRTFTPYGLETSKGEFAQGIALGLVLLLIAFLVNFLLAWLRRMGRA